MTLRVDRCQTCGRCAACGSRDYRGAPCQKCADARHTRYKIIAIQAAGCEGTDYMIRDTITGEQIGDWFQSRENAERWLAITGLQ